jgi:hypothetical protein
VGGMAGPTRLRGGGKVFRGRTLIATARRDCRNEEGVC